MSRKQSETPIQQIELWFGRNKVKLFLLQFGIGIFALVMFFALLMVDAISTETAKKGGGALVVWAIIMWSIRVGDTDV